MNEVTSKLMADYRPVLCIAVYQADKEYYLESHNISETGAVLEGKPLAAETIQGIVEQFYEQRRNQMRIGGLIPANLLHYSTEGSQYHLVWYRPAEQRHLLFAHQLNLPSGLAWVPAMIYSASNKALKVYALDSNERPTEDTLLYQAPFYNTNGDNGGVCLGSAKAAKADKTFTDTMRYWEDIFWNSYFTHGPSHTKSNMNMLWARLLANTDLQWQGLDELVPVNKTLSKLLKQ